MLRMAGESYWQAGINKKLPQKEAYLTGTYRGRFMACASRHLLIHIPVEYPTLL
jgi:hypothetical protein